MMCYVEANETITILGQKICAHCERDLCQTTVEQLKYDWYIWRLKQIWQSLGTL